MLVKARKRLTYFLSKNLEIKFSYRKLGHRLNTRVVGIFKLTDEIDIIKDGQQNIREQCSSKSKEDEKEENSEFATIMLLTTSISDVTPNDFEETYIKQLCDTCIESKPIKIVGHKKMTLITC